MTVDPMDPYLESTAEFAQRFLLKTDLGPDERAGALYAALPASIRDGLPSQNALWTVESLVAAATVVQVTIYVG